jgi:hypothetical protein
LQSNGLFFPRCSLSYSQQKEHDRCGGGLTSGLPGIRKRLGQPNEEAAADAETAAA